MPTHKYIYKPTGGLWPAVSVNVSVPPIPILDAHGEPVLDNEGKAKAMPANAWLDCHARVQEVTWAPGEPEVIRNKLIRDGGWIPKPGDALFNSTGRRRSSGAKGTLSRGSRSGASSGLKTSAT